MRCARTDKGVHAAGNIISLKLVIEDPDIVSKINEHLSPQIRVWGINRTNSSFNCYQMCDSRIYEYLIPTYCFLPPHPKSFLGEQIVELAKEQNDIEGYYQRQEEVAKFWDETEENYMKPAVQEVDQTIRGEALGIFYNHQSVKAAPKEAARDHDESIGEQKQDSSIPVEADAEHTDRVDTTEVSSDVPRNQLEKSLSPRPELKDTAVTMTEPKVTPSETREKIEQVVGVDVPQPKILTPVEVAVKSLKAAQAAAKRAHRIPKARLDRVRSTLSRFVGSHRFHNYTILKDFKDPSAMRVMKSFVVENEPVIIGGTEWLSLKVHGQSFMMHQIRKMVSAVALIVRCGCHEGRIQDTYLADRLSIPKAPSLGLLLERPVFDAYNEKLVEFGRERIEFESYVERIREFKQREIYERIFRDEERDGVFLQFFAGLDSTRSASLLWASSAGVKGTKKVIEKDSAVLDTGPTKVEDVEEDDEDGAQEDN